MRLGKLVSDGLEKRICVVIKIHVGQRCSSVSTFLACLPYETYWETISVRMVWASKMGRKFDPDAKRWRYRSSLLFALGNGLEVMTYVYPAFFLLLATTANACKQMSMLTSSATRNAIYNSFRDGTRENIGDITAKVRQLLYIHLLLCH